MQDSMSDRWSERWYTGQWYSVSVQPIEVLTAPPPRKAARDYLVIQRVFARGKIEEGSIIRQFFARTGQPLLQDWLIAMARAMAMKLPVKMMMGMGLASLFKPRTRGWDGARRAILDYVQEKEAEHRKALGLDETRKTQAAE